MSTFLAIILICAQAFGALASGSITTASRGVPDVGDIVDNIAECLSSDNKYERLKADNTVVLFIEMQSGLIAGVKDHQQEEYRNNLSGFIKLCQAFNLPVVITTINEPINGPLLPELAAAFPKAPVISRPGEINAWEHKDVVAAVKKTKKKNLLIAGISTDGCVAYVSLSAKDDGYNVYTLIDISGTFSELSQRLAIQRLVSGGVTPINWFAVAGELQNDWRNPTAPALFGIFAQHWPHYGNLIEIANAKK